MGHPGLEGSGEMKEGTYWVEVKLLIERDQLLDHIEFRIVQKKRTPGV